MQNSQYSHQPNNKKNNNGDDENNESEGPFDASFFSRYARKDAKRSMFASLSESETEDIENAAYSRLEGCRTLVYQPPLTAELVLAHLELERFVCYGAQGLGCTEKTSGGIYNSAQYIQIGLTQACLPEEKKGFAKNIKFMAHKLALTINSTPRIRYNRLEECGGESSHLCHSTRGCWRPSHLTIETHAQNMARSSHHGCAGWIWWTSSASLVCYCMHTPACQFVRVFFSPEQPTSPPAQTQLLR